MKKEANTKKIIFKGSEPPKLTRVYDGKNFGFIKIGKGPSAARKFFETEEDYINYLEEFKERQMRDFRNLSGLLGSMTR